MNKNLILILIILLFFLLVFLETTIFNFPFVFLYLAIMLIMVKRTYTSIGAVAGGIVIDSIRVSGFGLTPIFLIATILTILVYEKYSGSRDLLLAGVIVALFGFMYTHFLSYSMLLTVGFIISTFVAWQVFRISQRKSSISL